MCPRTPRLHLWPLALLLLGYSATSSADCESGYTEQICYDGNGTCCYDVSRRSMDDDEFQTLAQFFQNCNGLSWTNERNWCYGDDFSDSLREVGGLTTNDQCLEDVMIDPCTGLVFQYPVDYNATVLADDDSDILTDQGVDYAWDGITCLNGDSVGDIRLPNDAVKCNLEKDSGLETLTNLELLDLKRNSLTGHIPEWLGDLVGLDSIDLGNNDLNGTISNSIGNATDLATIILATNALTGTIPPSIAKLELLSDLELNANDLTGTIPDDLSLLTLVENLQLQGNVLTGTIPDLSSFTLLTRVSLATNSLAGTIPTMAGLTSLLRVDLHENSLTGSLPSELSTLTLLTRLNAASNSLSGYLPDLPSSIEELYLTGADNFWWCPFPSPANSIIDDAIALLNCTCMPGSFCPDGKTGEACEWNCTLCDAGTFSNTTDSLGCRDCPRGTFSLEGADVCTDCSPGTFNNVTQQSSCRECFAGRYTPFNRSVDCLDCPRGTYANSTGFQQCPDCVGGVIAPDMGTVDCLECPIGRSWFNTTDCADCDLGRFSGSTGAANCTQCTSGTFADTFGSRNCTDCEPGSFAALDGSPNCTLCSPGFFQQNTGQDNCTECNFIRGYFSNVSGAIECSVCPGGEYSRNNTQCALCPGGRYGSGPANTRYSVPSEVVSAGGPRIPLYQCYICDAGTFAEAGARDCENCEEGYIAEEEGSSECEACPAGRHWETTVECEDCEVGKAMPDTAESECDDCQPGTFASGLGFTECRDCPAGTAAPSLTSTACTNCSAGTYSGLAASECIDCFPGTFSAEIRSESCDDCPAGSAGPGYARTNCTVCPRGTAAEAASPSCDDCPGGRYSNEPSSKNCTAVPAGYYSINTTDFDACEAGEFSLKAASSCTLCPAGRFSDSDASDECDECPAGTFQSVRGQTDCDDLPAGFASDEAGVVSISNATVCNNGSYAASPGSENCTLASPGFVVAASSTNQTNQVPCPEGTYAPVQGLSSCLDCPTGRYNPLIAQSVCASCSGGTANNRTGSTSSSDCRTCSAGWYAPEASAECLECPGGRFANTSGQSSCPFCANGSVVTEDRTDCDLCEAGFYASWPSTAGECQPCPEDTFSAASGSAECLVCVAPDFTDGNGSTACVDGSRDDDECSLAFDAACETWFTAAAASLSFLIILLACCLVVCRSRAGVLGKYYWGGSHEYYRESLSPVDPAGTYIVRIKALPVYKDPDYQSPKLRVLSIGDQIEVVAQVGDFLLLEDGAGCVLNFSRSRGPTVQRLDDSSGAATSHGQSSMTSSGANPMVGLNKSTFAKRASAAFATLYQPQEDEAPGAAVHAASAQAGFYFVEIPSEEEVRALHKNKQLEEPAQSEGIQLTSTGKSAKGAPGIDDNSPWATAWGVDQGSGSEPPPPPPPPTKKNPYNLIQVRDDPHAVDLPPIPIGEIPPRLIAPERLLDAARSTYEVTYERVHVRAEPTMRSQVVGVKKKGDLVVVQEERHHWVRIGEPEGWMLRFQKKFGQLLMSVDVENWDCYDDPVSGKTYYYNPVTKECSWRHPARRIKVPPPPDPRFSSPAPTSSDGPSSFPAAAAEGEGAEVEPRGSFI